MDDCKHLESLWGRCTSCGLTWERQAKERTRVQELRVQEFAPKTPED